jgi:hypothetical protein
MYIFERLGLTASESEKKEKRAQRELNKRAFFIVILQEKEKVYSV